MAGGAKEDALFPDVTFAPCVKVHIVCERFFLPSCLFDSADVIPERKRSEGELFPQRSLYTYLRTAAFHTRFGRKRQ